MNLKIAFAGDGGATASSNSSSSSSPGTSWGQLKRFLRKLAKQKQKQKRVLQVSKRARAGYLAARSTYHS